MYDSRMTTENKKSIQKVDERALHQNFCGGNIDIYVIWSENGNLITLNIINFHMHNNLPYQIHAEHTSERQSQQSS